MVPGPASETGEDMAELQVHAGRAGGAIRRSLARATPKPAHPSPSIPTSSYGGS